MVKKRERKIPEVLVFTDINNYADDLASFVILAYLADKKLINIRGIITELGSYEIRRRRAMYAKGVMSYLGYPFLRAVPGGDYEIQNEDKENRYVENEITPVFEKAGITIHRSGTIFLQEYMKSVKEKNVIILLNAPFADFGKYLKATHDVIKQKVKKIIVMGNVTSQKDKDGYYEPDLASFNFKLCDEAAKELFRYVQEKDVRTVIVPSETVKTLQMDYTFLEPVAKSKNPVVKALLKLKDEANPTSMTYDMISSLCLADGIFKASGGIVEKEEGVKQDISFAKIADSKLMKEKICEIFKEKLEPKKISFEHLKKPQHEEKQSNA